MISGFSIGAGLAAVDIEAKLATTFGWALRHLAAAVRLKFANIFTEFFRPKLFETKSRKSEFQNRNMGWPVWQARLWWLAGDDVTP